MTFSQIATYREYLMTISDLSGFRDTASLLCHIVGVVLVCTACA